MKIMEIIEKETTGKRTQKIDIYYRFIGLIG